MNHIVAPLIGAWNRGIHACARVARNCFYLPYIFNTAEWRVFLVLVVITIVSGGLLTFRASHFAIVHTPDYGGMYREGMVGTPSLINPLFALRNSVDGDLVSLLYSGLVRVGADQKIEPDLAEQFTVSPDRRTYTFRLRTDARWHDDEPITADDVVFTIRRIQDPEMKSPLEPSFRGVEATTVDAHTVQIQLREAFAPFLDSLTVGILPEHLWKDVPQATAQLAEYNIRPIGSGPFKFETLIRDKRGAIKSYTIASSRSFYRGAAYLDGIRFTFFSTADDAVKALDKGEIDGIGGLPAEWENGVPDETFRRWNLPLSQYTALFFNQERRDALKDKRVREALARAIDRETLIRDVLGGTATPIGGPIVLGALGYTAEVASYPQDRERAAAILDEAGWKVISAETYAEKKAAERAAQEKAMADRATQETTSATNPAALRDVESSTRETPLASSVNSATTPPESEERQLPFYRQKGETILSVRLSTVDHPEHMRVAEHIRDQWEALGVRVELVVHSENFQRAVLEPRAYDILLFGIIVGRDPDPYPFWHSSQKDAPGANIARFANREVDALLEDARRTDDTKTRTQKYEQFQKTLTNEIPAHFLYAPSYTYLMRSQFRGFAVARMSKPSDRFLNVHEWYRETRLTIESK